MSADTIPVRSSRMYPVLKVTKTSHPSRFFAIPLIGILVKILMLIPIDIFVFFTSVAVLVVLVANSFVVFFTGKYLEVCYRLVIGVIRLHTKVSFFYAGVIDTYPKFSLQTQDDVDIEIAFPKNPNKWFAFPLVGGVARIIMLLPFYVWSNIVANATTVALVISWIPVLFKGMYPDTTFEIVRDSARLNASYWAYIAGLTDTYPTFWISFNHKKRKILLIIAGILLFLSNSTRNTNPQQKQQHNGFYKIAAPTPSHNNSPTYQ